MLNDKERAEIDQNRAALCELNPLLWWGQYRGCLNAGFSKAQAMGLVKAYLTAMVMSAAANRSEDEIKGDDKDAP